MAKLSAFPSFQNISESEYPENVPSTHWGSQLVTDNWHYARNFICLERRRVRFIIIILTTRKKIARGKILTAFVIKATIQESPNLQYHIVELCALWTLNNLKFRAYFCFPRKGLNVSECQQLEEGHVINDLLGWCLCRPSHWMNYSCFQSFLVTSSSLS